jgi:hypothetical protein
MKYKKSGDELRRECREQVELLLSAVMGFDAGREIEAKNIALRLRVLLHDTPKQTSALTHVGLKSTLKYLDTCQDSPPGNLLMEQPLVLTEFSPTGVRFRAILDEPIPPFLRPQLVAFDAWWKRVVLWHETLQKKFSREALVLTMADKDGGAHIDEDLSADYAWLTRQQVASGTTMRQGVSTPVLPLAEAVVRQIAHELLKGLHHQAPEMFPAGASATSLGVEIRR